MNRNRRHIATLLGATFLVLVASTAGAQFALLGPTPYSRAADSPFDLSGLGSTFFLEDFEDWFVNTPGVTMDGGGIGIAPSVDADDGMLDGMDHGGHSSSAIPYSCSGSACFGSADFLFDKEALGFWPTAAGIVVTSTRGIGTALFAYDGTCDFANVESCTLASYSFAGLTSEPGSASDDFFVGVTNPQGISYMFWGETTLAPPVGTGTPSSTLDHLQYGLIAPEPSGAALVAIGGLVYWTWRLPPSRVLG